MSDQNQWREWPDRPKAGDGVVYLVKTPNGFGLYLAIWSPRLGDSANPGAFAEVKRGKRTTTVSAIEGVQSWLCIDSILSENDDQPPNASDQRPSEST